jgi:hypothetical protein
VEGFSTPQYTKRIASAACQAPPHRPMELLLYRLWDLWSSSSAPYPTRAALPQTPTPQTHTISAGLSPLRPAKPVIHTCTISTGPCPQACTGLHNLPWDHAPKAYQAANPQTHMISTLPGPHSSRRPDPCSKGLLVHLKERPLPIDPWNPTHQPPATGGLQTYLRDTHRQVWMLKE